MTTMTRRPSSTAWEVLHLDGGWLTAAALLIMAGHTDYSELTRSLRRWEDAGYVQRRRRFDEQIQWRATDKGKR